MTDTITGKVGELVDRLAKLTSPDAEMLSDGYRLSEIIKLNPADSISTLLARVDAPPTSAEIDAAAHALERDFDLGQPWEEICEMASVALHAARATLPTNAEEGR